MRLEAGLYKIYFDFSTILWVNLKEIEVYTQNLSLLCEQSHAVLLNNDKYVIKICKAQRFPKDYFRKYLGKSQANREYKGAHFLKNIGIQTAEPLYFSYSLSPFSKIESIYVMSYLSDYSSVSNLDDEKLHLALKLIAKDLKIMKANNVFFKDLHLNNIMYCNNEIRWIDTDIKIIDNLNEYNMKWNLSIKRMLKPLTKSNQNFFLELVQ